MKRLLATTIIGLVVCCVMVSCSVLFHTEASSAASGGSWRAGRIIDDFIFTNADSMSVQDIQNFLNEKIGTCDVWGTGIATEYGYSGTRAQYAAANGWPGPPYTCLNIYSEVPKTSPSTDIPANNYSTPSTIPSGAQSAAWIIKDAANRYQISPQVLLIKIATESAGPLTSDAWPLFSQYRYAMGAHCPDSGPGGSANCDPNYSGFSMQMYEAAKLLRSYLDNMDQPWWGCEENDVRVQCAPNRSGGSDPGGGYKVPGATNYILWNVSESGCAGQDIYIENKATAALYTYTPYQPNQAALDNMYGTGDGCSAYGNRNFFRYFSDWFGPTTGYFLRTSEDGKIYVLGSNNDYYYVPNYNQLTNYGYSYKVSSIINISSSYLTGLTNRGNLPSMARFGTSPDVYLMDSGNKYYVSYAAYQAYGSPAVASLALNYGGILYPAPNLSTVIRQYGDPKLYSIQGGKRRHIGDQAVYVAGGYNSIPTTSLSGYSVASIQKGSPILQAGTVTYTVDTKQYAVVSGDTSTQTPLTSQLGQSLGKLGVYSDTSAYINLITPSGTPITHLASDGGSTYYLLDGDSKYKLSPTQITSLGKTSAAFGTAPTSLLGRLTTRVASSKSLLVRKDSGQTVYELNTGKMYRIESLSDFNILGHSFNNVLDLKSSTVNAVSSDSNASIVPPGILFNNAGGSTIYIMGDDSTYHQINTGSQFVDYGFSFTDVRRVSSVTFATLTSSEAFTGTVKAPDGSLWLITRGVRHWIDPSLASAYRSSNADFVSTPSWRLNQMRVGQNATRFIRIDSTPTVYYLNNGTKQIINSPAAFASISGSSWNDVVSVSQSFADTLTAGSTIY